MLALAALAAGLIFPAAGEAATRTFTPVADAYTRSDEPTVNHGDGGRLTARGHRYQKRISYLRFHPDVPADETITSARLVLHSVSSGMLVDLYGVDSNRWDEAEITWDNQPALDPSPTWEVQSFESDTGVSFDASALVTGSTSKLRPGSGSVSMAVTADPNGNVRFHSREAGWGRPRLIVETEPVEATDPTPTPAPEPDPAPEPPPAPEPAPAPAPPPAPDPTPAPSPAPTPSPGPDAGYPKGGSGLPARLPASNGETFYVSTSGSDSADGSIGSPWRTVQKALGTLTAGQTAYVRGGTYTQNLKMTRGGTAGSPITIREYPGEQAILKAGSGASNNMPLEIGNGAAFVRFQGLTFDGATGASTTNIYASGSAHDIEFSDCEVRNSERQGFFSEKSSSRIQIIGCRFHDNGGTGPTQLDHNIYIQGSYNAVIGNLLEGAVNGNGIQVYPSSDNIVIASNTITGNFREGIIIGSDGSTTASDALIVNNVITDSQTGITTYWGGSKGTGNVARSNLAYGNSRGSFNGDGIAYADNITSNPLFVALLGSDLHLGVLSPALGIADPAYTPAIDLDGNVRPLGSGPDLGAFER